MLFALTGHIRLENRCDKNLSDDEGEGGEEILEVMVTSVFKNGCDKNSFKSGNGLAISLICGIFVTSVFKNGCDQDFECHHFIIISNNFHFCWL